MAIEAAEVAEVGEEDRGGFDSRRAEVGVGVGVAALSSPLYPRVRLRRAKAFALPT